MDGFVPDYAGSQSLAIREILIPAIDIPHAFVRDVSVGTPAPREGSTVVRALPTGRERIHREPQYVARTSISRLPSAFR